MGLADQAQEAALDMLLNELADKTGQSISEVLDKALAAYRRDVFLTGVNQSYAELRANPEAWEEFQADHKEWDDAPLTEVKPDEQWTDDGECSPKKPEESGH